jgi:DNA repair exonuclease SbcCD ATPase subunit
VRIKALVPKNWLCFRGEHPLTLDPKAYAVVAAYDDDPTKSNWGGKSALVGSVPFALYGSHDKVTEDEWIHEGESVGGVELHVEDLAGKEYRILRERHRGKATVLHVDGVGLHLRKEEAQSWIIDTLGLTEQDFRATCWFEQGHMARLILSAPADRMKVVGGWLDLEPLERCTRNAGGQFTAAIDKVGDKLAAIRARSELLDQIMRAPDGGALTLNGLQKHFESCAAALQTAKQNHALEEAAVAENNRRHDLQRSAEELDSISAEIGRFDWDDRPEVEAALVAEEKAAHDALVETTATFNQRNDDLREKEKLALGQFDGRCPVAGIACPAKDAINADRKKAAELKAVADRARAFAVDAVRDRREAHRLAAEKLRNYQARKVRIEGLRKRAADLDLKAQLAAKNRPEDSAALQARLEAARQRLDEAMAAQSIAYRALAEATKLTNEVKASEQDRADLEAQLVHLRGAVQVFHTSKRVLAEGVLAEIEDDANSALAQAGVDLSVAVRWGRETKGLARNCVACGAPFPPSAKVKECPRCAEPRGPHFEPRLDILPSDRSGGANDLAGAFTQLAAAKWLKTERGSSWSCALLDELWGQLDDSNRRALTSHVAALLRDRYGFSQSLVVAHHAAVLDSLPGRILVRRDGAGRRSRAEVIA